ncbi:MAG: CHASE domain-containing protein, partial [Emcibacteraceae bacterium]|nr:CHASE domain-containing protein [Emcibacteraceae bacterium]
MKSKINNIIRNNYLILLIVVSVSYFILGQIGYFLSEGSGFAALIWPPAGAALIFMMKYGYRVWPGIFLGALLVSASTLPAIVENPVLIFTYPQLFTISAGATIQAYIATWLVRKFKVSDHDFSEPKKIGLFYCLIGPVACLTNSTTAFLSFFLLGISSFNSLIEEWFLWWVTDSASTIIFVTLFLTIFTFERKRSVIITIILGMAFLVTFGMFFIGRLWEQERITLLFTQEVISATDTLEHIEARHSTLINYLIGFEDNEKDISKEQLEVFFKNNLQMDESVRSIAWIKVVDDKDRSSFEQELKNVHGEETILWQYSDGEKIELTSPRDEYYFLSLIEPYDLNKNVIGIDISTDAVRKSTALSAAAINGPFVTSPVKLTLEPDQANAVTVYNPVFLDGKIKGYFALIIKLDYLINEMIANSTASDLEVSMRDKNTQDSPIISSTRVVDGYIDRSPIGVEVTMFNRTWELLFRRTLSFINKNKTSQPLFIGMTGMIFSALISIGIIILSGQRLFLEKLVQSRTIDLHKANLTKSQFMANMSHDLRTPLNAIIGFSDIMQKELYGKHEIKKYLEYSKDINHSSEYLLSLINDVLDFSAIEANKRKINKERIDIPFIINDCLRTISALSEKKQIQLDIVCNPDLPELIADKISVKQILINVLSNAVKFTPNEGNVIVDADCDRNNIIIKVSDTGEGITKDN